MLTSLWLALSVASADPCGMVPPIWSGNGPAPQVLERAGLQETYTFFRDGVQTIAIRPGFTGSVEQFGMLVPLPSAPALRKIDDRTFTQLANAVDPPVVTVHVEKHRPRPMYKMSRADGAPPPVSASPAMEVARDQVVVVSEEAVGMYEVAVLEAGSAKALQKWMDRNGFRYPDGMDDTVEDYVHSGWMFVAIKAKVGTSAGVQPQAGMREVDPRLPPGASFDGYVQGMAFRFEVDEPVIPMRLSTFNGDETHNRVYVLTDSPVRIDEVSKAFVRRQVRGRDLHRNVTDPLPVRYIGPRGQVGPSDLANIDAQRDSDPYVAVARDLAASDLMAVSRGELTLPFEEREKELLRINEALNLRGAGIDRQVELHTAEARAEAVKPALSDLYEMTLTVIDGNFDADVIRERNLHLSRFDVPSIQNTHAVWNVQTPGPTLWVYY